LGDITCTLLEIDFAFVGRGFGSFAQVGGLDTSRSKIGVDVPGGDFVEVLEVAVAPGGGAVEFPGEEVGDEGGGFDGGAGVEEEGAGAAGEDVFDRARHFPAGGPDGLAGEEGKARVEFAGELRVGCGDGLYAGEVGAGHYAKMVHNGIEYAIMQAWAEGYELMSSRPDLIKNVTGTFKAWERGTVVRSWLLELLVKALEEDPDFKQIEGYVDDSGEGRWTVEEALNNAVPVPTISASIFARFVSRQGDSPSMKAVAALRNQFGGHAVRKS